MKASHLNLDCAEKIALSSSSWISLVRAAVTLEDHVFAELWRLHPRRYDKITIFGKRVSIPRYQRLYGNGIEYPYSGSIMKSRPIAHGVIKGLMDYVNRQQPAYNYNAVLVNWYRDGSHSMGAHSDDEACLVAEAPIYSFSFGASRLFRVTGKADNRRYDFMLDDGSLVIMGGNMQQEFKHAIPKTARKTGRRMNMTFRCFREP